MSVKITGAKELADAIGKLPIEFQRTAEYQVLGSGAKVITKYAKAFAPQADGDLKASIGFNVKGYPGKRTARIGPRAAYQRTVGIKTRGKNKGKPIIKKPAFYVHLVEFGSARAPAQPFIAPAIEQGKGEAFDAMAKGYEKALDRIVKKIRGKAKR